MECFQWFIFSFRFYFWKTSYPGLVQRARFEGDSIQFIFMHKLIIHEGGKIFIKSNNCLSCFNHVRKLTHHKMYKSDGLKWATTIILIIIEWSLIFNLERHWFELGILLLLSLLNIWLAAGNEYYSEFPWIILVNVIITAW